MSNDKFDITVEKEDGGYVVRIRPKANGVSLTPAQLSKLPALIQTALSEVQIALYPADIAQYAEALSRLGSPETARQQEVLTYFYGD